MYRKKVFDDVGPYNENLARTEDNEMHYRMKQKGYKFLLSPNIKSYRYARSDLKGMIKQNDRIKRQVLHHDSDLLSEFQSPYRTHVLHRYGRRHGTFQAPGRLRREISHRN